ncbi:MAG: hypothetical protein ACRCW0_10575 [Clostridium sp.]
MTKYNETKKSFKDVCKALKKEDIKLLATTCYNRFYGISEFTATFGKKSCYDYVLISILRQYNKDLIPKIDEALMMVFLEMYRPEMFSKRIKAIIEESSVDYENDWLVLYDYFTKYHSWIESEIYARDLEESLENNLGPFALIDLKVSFLEETNHYSCPFCQKTMKKINFHQGKKFELSTYEGIKNVENIHTCDNCKIFTAPQLGKNLSDEKIYYKKIINYRNYKLHLDIFKGNI